jgi:hypothetical protein
MKIREIINEAQVFDFNKYKPEIIKYIQRAKSGQSDAMLDSTLFYNIIVNKPAVGSAQKSNITIDPKVWKNYFSQQPFNSNGVFSQRDFNANLKSSQNNINFYITVEKSNKNIVSFVQNLGKLDSALQKLANDTQSRISYKTHTILDAFVDHNDSLKIYYNDPRLKSQIEGVVKAWANDNGIVLGNRTHQHGLDTDKSFGERLSVGVEKATRATIEKYKDQYTDEQYFQWIVTHMPGMVQTAKETAK